MNPIRLRVGYLDYQAFPRIGGKACSKWLAEEFNTELTFCSSESRAAQARLIAKIYEVAGFLRWVR